VADAQTLNRFSWHELLTTDPAAAIDFYTNVVGWKTEQYDGTGKPYTMWRAGEAAIGGVMDLPEEARAMGVPPHWMGYVTTPDAEATVARAASLGGQAVVPPFPIPTVGTIAVLRDPQGAVFSLLQPETDMPARPPERGDVSWCELMTPDPQAAISFYGELFGWHKHSEMDMGPGGIYHLIDNGDEPFGGVYESPAAQGPPAWLYYFMVDSADAASERAKEEGGQIVHGPMDIPGGDRIAICTDPQGAWFAVHSKATR